MTDFIKHIEWKDETFYVLNQIKLLDDLITAIITEKGVVTPPFKENLAKLFGL